VQGKGKFLVAGLLIVGAVIYLIVTSTGRTAQYFLTIEELEAMGKEAIGRNVTISGAVLGDSIVYDAQGLHLSFTIVHVPGSREEIRRAGGLAAVLHRAVNDPNAARLDVVYEGPKPDLLQHEAQAIISGHLGEDGIFHADELLLKCPTRYKEELPRQAGETQ